MPSLVDHFKTGQKTTAFALLLWQIKRDSSREIAIKSQWRKENKKMQCDKSCDVPSDSSYIVKVDIPTRAFTNKHF
jgi:hypothetical protein